jgi:hypothetical protein
MLGLPDLAWARGAARAAYVRGGGHVMPDAKLTKLTGRVLIAVRDQVDRLIQRGEVDKEQLRLVIAPAARKE